MNHGMSHGGSNPHELYRTWAQIIQRSTNPTNPAFKYYGGRGVPFHPPWRHDFPAFLKWITENLGDRPPGMTLDRIDNNLGYIPGNLKWSTKQQQALNRRPRRPGLTGIELQRERYFARIKVSGKMLHLGGFSSLDEAIAARKAAEQQYFGGAV